MQPFTTHTGIVAVLNRGNIDTDQIISKEFLKSIKKTGFGEQLFHHWRYLENGNPNPSFELNKPEFKDASILIAGNNFGCGSSREHAVWAVVQAGFRVLIAPTRVNGAELIPGFADIFRNNSSKNGLLLLEFSENEVNQMRAIIESNLGIKAIVDLPAQTVTLKDKAFSFKIDPATKVQLLEGLDDIGQTEKQMPQIVNFEKNHNPQLF